MAEATTTVSYIRPMKTLEARQCANKIKSHLESARSLILDLYERSGWEALGYSSWRECVLAEFEQSQAHIYRQLRAGMIEREISPIGETGSIPESHLRPLEKLEPGERSIAWDAANATAPEGGLTADRVTKAVESVKAKPKELTFCVDREITIAAKDSPHCGQTVRVVKSNDVIVHCETLEGTAIPRPFLSAELSSPTPAPAQAPGKPSRVDPLEATQFALEIEQERVKELERVLRDICAAARSGNLTDDLLNEAEALIEAAQ